MMPLMYTILKYARADLEEASQRIDEGNLFYFPIFSYGLAIGFYCKQLETNSCSKICNCIMFTCM